MKILYNRRYFLNLSLQCLGAMLFMLMVLFSLNTVLADDLIWAAGASTLASSAYIVFGSPKAAVAKPYRMLTGYAIAIVCGYLLQLIANDFCHGSYLCSHPEHKIHVFEAAAALSVGLSFLLMFILRASHPPAAGLAVVMVLDISNPAAIAVICGGALLLVIIRWLFAKKLRPLV